jgi:deoxycytidine triphosphate deaminase
MTEEEQDSAEDNRLIRDPRDEVWKNWQGAVLLRNEIEQYCSLDPPLIGSLDDDLLKPASYLLRLGEECRVSGKDHNLSDKNPKLVIPPHAIAVVSTFEELNIPGFLVGRWNLRVTEVYEGLLWVGGAQVDPGYEGHLYCPLYNLSTRPVELRFKDPLFAIDFVRTTRFVEGKSRLWERKRKDCLGAHDIHYLQSATSEELARVDAKASRIEQTQHFMVLALAVIVMAVTVVAMLGVFGQFEGSLCLNWVSIGVSGLAILMAFAALSFSLIRRKKK